MIEYNEKSKNLLQKTVLIVLELIFIYLSYLILFKDWGYYVLQWLHIKLTPGNHLRAVMLFTFNIIVFLAYLPTIIVFVKRKMSWEETFTIPIAFAIYYIGFALLGYNIPLDQNWIDWLGVILFVLGVSMHLAAEYQRHLFKQNPENKGKLMTTGLWSISRHVNYFSDLLWVSGYALVTRNWWSAIIPALLFIFFYFFNIPLQEKHLAEKYGNQFKQYKNKTKALIPFIL